MCDGVREGIKRNAQSGHEKASPLVSHTCTYLTVRIDHQ